MEMPEYIVKIRDLYAYWSTIVDAPTSPGYTKEEMLAEELWLKGPDAEEKLKERLARADKTGTSAHDSTLHDIISFNRAGPDESCLTERQIYDMLREYREDVRTDMEDPPGD